MDQNAPVEIQTYPLNRFLCWHSRKYLRLLSADNGAEVYCSKCGLKRFGYLAAAGGGGEA